MFGFNYRVHGVGIIRAKTYLDFVRKMRTQDMIIPSGSNSEYMYLYSGKYSNGMKKPIRFMSPIDFVEDIISNGLAIEIHS